MINLAPIPKKIQQRLFEKMNALSKVVKYPDSNRDMLTFDKIASRTTFIKMISGQENPVILMGGELIPSTETTDSVGNKTLLAGGKYSSGYNDIYGPRVYFDETFDETLRGQNVTKRPMPGIKSIDVQFKGGVRALREATINWTCWSFDDIDRLMPHFLSHGKTVMVEWGWIYDSNSISNLPTLIDSSGIKRDAFTNPMEEVIEGRGDFDFLVGIVKNFEFTTREDGAFDCQTIISSVGVSLMDNPMPNEEVLDPGLTYNLNLNQDEVEVAQSLETATGGITQLDKDGDFESLAKRSKKQNADKDEILDLNTTVTLKTFINQIDKYIKNKLRSSKTKKTITFGREDIIYESKKYIEYDPNNQADQIQERNNHSYWVRWGWFEDNVLSKFLSLTAPNADRPIISEFRSIENKVDLDGVPTGNYESVRIRNAKHLETIDINRYILPGQFIPQKRREKNTPYKSRPSETKANDIVSNDDGKGVNANEQNTLTYKKSTYLVKARTYGGKIGSGDTLYKKVARITFSNPLSADDSIVNLSVLDSLDNTQESQFMLRAIIEDDDINQSQRAAVQNKLDSITAELNKALEPVEKQEEEEDVIKGKWPITLEGDDEKFHKLAAVVNDKDNFPYFTTESDIIEIEPPTEKSVHSESMMKRVRKYKDKNWAPEKDNKKFMACWNDYDNWKDGKIGKDTVKAEEAKPGRYGYLRNMLINTELIKQAFGVSNDFTVETINIIEAIEQMFRLLNQDLKFWNFEVTVDSVEDYRVKIIDDHASLFDFTLSTKQQRSKFENDDVKSENNGKLGVFFFPVWRNDSIVKKQNITAKVPNEMALATMYGSSMNQLKDFTNTGNQFTDKEGVLLGGLYNNDNDTSKKGLDIAFRNKASRNIGNSSGDSDEVLTIDGGDNIYEEINTLNLEGKYEERLFKLNTNIKARADAKTKAEAELMFDESIPPPLINQMKPQQLDALLRGEVSSEYTTKGGTQDKKYFQKLYSNKYRENGKLRKEWIQTINFLSSTHGEYASAGDPLLLPLELELDIDGTGGVYPGNSFHSTYLPKKYQENTVFQMFDVNHSVDSSGWTTTITGKMRATMSNILLGFKTFEELYKEQIDNYNRKVELRIKESRQGEKEHNAAKQQYETQQAIAKKQRQPQT